MASPVTNHVLDWSDPIHGTFELSGVTDWSQSDGDAGEVLYDVAQKVIGTQQSRGSSPITLTQTVTVENARKPDWKLLKSRGLRCLITRSGYGADKALAYRESYSVKVVKVDDGTDNKGAATRTIELAVETENDQ